MTKIKVKTETVTITYYGGILDGRVIKVDHKCTHLNKVHEYKDIDRKHIYYLNSETNTYEFFTTI